ncbi:hypothetical protein H6G80_17800 [Nostoc sp. FACHB-87]|uniref:hypothetical protein n=1 Tax=Nostocales TaxID=1161 RepID=UPI0016865208|nr:MULTISPECIES: hypothetical protein [Nostocales]MBD2298518.1 hypothetical protein [Nostoc sp. FACHB-190]MBD2455927.1 hypothetical protein [Nostoc sp. FACHB-87]MBD2474513.1 hypothetical protein [Anabaena sp. FACHB-83]MBD2486946.1 hypothetical protein [Aulosira sp. FACHB-615]
MIRGSGDQNLVVLTLYIIGVSYTFNRMIESIDDKVKYTYKADAVNEQLTAQELKDQIGISFKLNPAYGLDDVKELQLTIENKSDNLAVYVDWENSTLVVEHTKQSRRVIRISSSVTRDLAIPQTPSLITPKKTLSEKITAEDVLELDTTAGTYSAKKPLVSISGLKNGGPPQKKLYNDFMNRGKELEFSLQLVLRISDVRVGIAPGINIPPMYLINCPFTIKKLPWTYALPWNKKKK